MDDGHGRAGRMKVFESIDPAFSHMQRMLFDKFDFTKWICLGVIIFCEVLIQFSSAPMASMPGNVGSYAEDFLGGFDDTISEAIGNAPVILATVGAALVAYLVWTAITTWITSRGQLMFVRAVALNEYEIGRNWAGTREVSTSLFVFRLAIKIANVFFLVLTIGVAIGAFALLRQADIHDLNVYFLVFAPIVLAWSTVASVFGMAASLQWNFVSPIMVSEGIRCMEAWKRVGPYLYRNILPLHLFYLVKFGVAMALSTCGFMLGCFTCCIGFLPVVSQTVLAPIYVFERAFAMAALESMDPRFRVLQPIAPPGAAEGRPFPPELPARGGL